MSYDFDRFFEEKLKELVKEDRIIDIGGGHPFQKRMAKYRYLFAGKRYETIDPSPVYNPTIIGDAHNLPLKNDSVSAILSISVFEHLHDPKKAAEEIYRVLKPGGKALIFTHFIYPYHARYGVYKDYFRFTEDGLRYLFRGFASLEIKKSGGYFRALFFFSPFQAALRPLWEPIAYFLDKLFKTEKHTTTMGYYIFAVK